LEALNKNTKPDEPKARVFYEIHRLYHFLPKKVKNPINSILFGISPDIPINLGIIFGSSKNKKIFWWAWIATFFFCFVVTAFLTSFFGVFNGTEADQVYFIHDKTNIINYIFLCPLYIALDFILIALVIEGIANTKQFVIKDHHKGHESKFISMSIPAVIFIVLCISFAGSINFVLELLNTSVYSKQFWFVELLPNTNTRVLGIVGFYYSFLNFVMQFISLLALIMYFMIFYSTMRLGSELKAMDKDSKITFEEVQARFYTFTKAYIVAKGLTAIYMLNVFTWRWSQSKHSVNMMVLACLMSFFGVFVISLPRYYIELQWHQLKVRQSKLPGHSEDKIVFEDIRPFGIKFIAWILDSLIIGGFISSFWL
jgi:hypothetical protein